MAERNITTPALRWIVGRAKGLSSEAIWAHMMDAGEPAYGWSHPHDPADLGRCLGLLALIPEWRKRLPEMTKRSPAWAALVSRWDEISKSMESEVGWNWSKGHSAPKTYELMQDALRGHDG